MYYRRLRVDFFPQKRKNPEGLRRFGVLKTDIVSLSYPELPPFLKEWVVVCMAVCIAVRTVATTTNPTHCEHSSQPSMSKSICRVVAKMRLCIAYARLRQRNRARIMRADQSLVNARLPRHRQDVTFLSDSGTLSPNVGPQAHRWFRKAKQMTETLYDFGTGRSDPATFPTKALQDAAVMVIERDRELLTNYPGSLGYAPLRQAMAKREGDREGISINPDHIALTNGSMQAVTLVAEALTEPGDSVITEEFTYPGTLSAYRSLKLDIQGIGMDADGMRMDLLEQRLQTLLEAGSPPKFIYVLTNYQNPGGTIMPLERRKQLIELGRRYAVPIVEDNCYGDVHYEGDVPPALFAMDDNPTHIYLGSLSKILAPGFRLGYLLAQPPMLDTLLARRHDAGPNVLASAIAAEFYADGISAHCDVSNPPLHNKLKCLTGALGTHLGELCRWSEPRGGLFLWLRYPDDVDQKKLWALAEEAGVKFLPGISFHYTNKKAPFLRLAFGHLTEDTIAAGVPVLAACIRKARQSNETPDYQANWLGFEQS